MNLFTGNTINILIVKHNSEKKYLEDKKVKYFASVNYDNDSIRLYFL